MHRLDNSHTRLEARFRRLANIPGFQRSSSTLLAAGQILIDPTRFAVDAEVARRFPELSYITLRIPFLAAGHFSAQTAIAAVRLEHMPFYRRVLRYVQVAASRSYPQLSKPLGLMLVDYPRNAPAVVRQYPFFMSLPDEGLNFFWRRAD